MLELDSFDPDDESNASAPPECEKGSRLHLPREEEIGSYQGKPLETLPRSLVHVIRISVRISFRRASNARRPSS